MLGRRAFARKMRENNQMKVYYRSEQNVDCNNSYSPSAQKPRIFVEALVGSNDTEIFGEWNPVTREDFYLIHSKDHFNSILDCKKTMVSEIS